MLAYDMAQTLLASAREFREPALHRPHLLPCAAAACFIVGTLLLATCLILHGDLPADVSMEAALSYIVAKPWYALHLGMMLTGDRKADLLLMAETGLRLLYGTGRTEIVIFYGLTFFLAGLGVALDGRYVRSLGAVGAVAGGAVVVLGGAALGGVALAPDKLVFIGIIPIEGAWLLVLGAHLWSRG
jgi:hypothetical protein